MADPVAVNWTRRLSQLGFVIAATAIFFWQLRHPVIRFSQPTANDVSGFALALGLPWFANAMVFRLGPRWGKIVSIIFAVPLVIYTGIVFLGLAMTGAVSFDRVSETPWRKSVVRLYRLNGGATTAFGVVIRQERAVFPGILLVHNLDSFYPCYSVSLVSTGEGVQAKGSPPACDAFGGQRRSYRLKPFIYF
jgi:hypothetical protein